MSKILMLDIEGVLIATSIPPKNQRFTKDYSVHKLNNYGIRPNAQQFVDEVHQLFDQIYLNTCIREDRALKIMKEIFGTSKLLYYNWDRSSPFGKTSGYEKFSGSKLIHVEDESPKNNESQRIIELGYTYISVATWTTKNAYVDNNKTNVDLLTTINTIKENLT